MTRSIISLILMIISVILSFRHGFNAFNYRSNPEAVKFMVQLGLSDLQAKGIALISISIGVMLIIPKTFVVGNIISALMIVTVMGLALNAGNTRMALMEIPFLLMPLLLIWLKYPHFNFTKF